MSLPRAFTALSGATAVSMAAQLIRGKLAALLLGPAGVGVFNQLSLLWNLFQIGGALGTGNGIIQHGTEAIASDDQPALRRLVSTSTVLLRTVPETAVTRAFPGRETVRAPCSVIEPPDAIQWIGTSGK